MTKKFPARRRRGLLADELATHADVSRYQAKQAIAIVKNAPQLIDHVITGQLELRQATDIIRHAPELVSYIIDGKLPCSECDRVIRELRARDEPELTFEERVEQSFKQWLSKWPKEDRKEVLDIATWMPAAKLADLIPSQETDALGSEIGPEQPTTGSQK